jgi:predicted PurR-regulated permease PerM
VAAAGAALGAVATELNWKDPIQVVAFLAAVGLLFLWVLVAVAGPLAPFFWALTLAFVL